MIQPGDQDHHLDSLFLCHCVSTVSSGHLTENSAQITTLQTRHSDKTVAEAVPVYSEVTDLDPEDNQHPFSVVL